MARWSEAVWRPLAEEARGPRIVPRMVILHTAVDSPRVDSLYPFFARADVRVSAHFFVRWDGTIEQYVDTERRAGHALAANGYAIGVETEDDGRPNQLPWSPEQVEALARLLRWASETHGIPLRLADSPTGSGVAYHSQFNDAAGWSPWSTVRGKTCPGLARIPQVPLVIAKAAEKGESVQVREDDLQTIAQWHQDTRKVIVDVLSESLARLEGKLDEVLSILESEDPKFSQKTRRTVRAYLRSVVKRLGGDLSGWD